MLLKTSRLIFFFSAYNCREREEPPEYKKEKKTFYSDYTLFSFVCLCVCRALTIIRDKEHSYNSLTAAAAFSASPSSLECAIY